MDTVVRKEITENLDIIINSAASINFSDHLLDALKTNYDGACRMLELAHECKHL
jgi:fatty acyl-CoA reductase